MPEWSDPKPQRPRVSAKDALKTLKESKEGESGIIELEGNDVLEFISSMFGDGEEGVPSSLQKLISGMGEGAVVAKVVRRNDIVTDEMKEVLAHHASTRAEDDDFFWDAEREVGEGTSSYREMKQMAEFALANIDNPVTHDQSAAKAFAFVILYLIEQVMSGSNLLRDGQKLIEQQRVAVENAAKYLDAYRTHMITEHGVVPDDLKD